MSKKSILIFAITFVTSSLSNAQGLGLGIAYAISNSINIELIYSNSNDNFKLGFTAQFADTKGKLVDSQLPNYGTTIDGMGNYFLTIDVGYGKTFIDKLQVDGELSIGSKKYYTNYIDNRFTGGGYHLITKSDPLLGIGVNVGYLISYNWSIYTGYNSVRGLQFGIRVFLDY